VKETFKLFQVETIQIRLYNDLWRLTDQLVSHMIHGQLRMKSSKL